MLRREGDSVARQIMKENGHIYVCGDCTMAEDVYQTLKSIVQEIGNFTDSEVESYMLSLRVCIQIFPKPFRFLLLLTYVTVYFFLLG